MVFAAGEGVGTVTLPGLPLSVGEPAINPKPREMMAEAIGEVAAEFGAAPDVTITVSIPGGAELAERTSNPRLGIVGGLSVINTMIMAVSERTREIGLKKAVGANDPDILAEIVVDAGIVGGLGGLAGLAFGWGTTQVINAVTTHLENLHVLEVTPRLAVGAIIFTVLLGMFAGLYPAWRASRLDPVVALRTE